MKSNCSKLFIRVISVFMILLSAWEGRGQCRVSAGNDTTVCQYLPFVRNATTNISNPQFQWYLQGNSTNVLSTTVSLNYTPSQTSFQDIIVKVTGTYNNNICTAYDTVRITVNQSPQVDAGSDKIVCQNISLTITANASPNNAQITWYALGSTNSLVNGPSITLSNSIAGIQSYVVKAIGSNGCYSYDTVRVNVQPAPNANFTFSSNCGRRISFTDSSTTASGSTITGWQWNFGDNSRNNTSTNQNPDHKYNQNNSSYSVRLIVTNNYGCKDTVVRTISTGSGPLPSLISDSTDITLADTLYFYSCYTSGGSFPFYNNSQNTNPNTTYIIRWGDDSTDILSETTFPAQGGTPIVHSYLTSGTYNITFVQNNNNGCVDSVIYKVFFGSVPAGSLGSNLTTTICTGSDQSVIISNTSSNTNGTIYSLVFNDGSDTINLTHPISDPYSVNHIFNTSSCGTNSSNGSSTLQNSYGAYLTVKNPCGTRPLAVLGIYVASTPNADFTVSPRDTICVSQEVTLTNTGDPGRDVNSATGVCTPGKFVWQINPNTPSTLFQVTSGSLGSVSTANPANWTSGTNNVNIRFNSPGIYSVREIAANTASCAKKDTAQKNLCVNPTPTASFILNKDSGCVPLVVVATGATNLATCGTNSYSWSVSYLPLNGCDPGASDWSFINNTSSTSQGPQFQFINPGYYIIKLITIAPNGTCESIPFIDTVKVIGKPTVNISSLAAICNGQSVTPLASATCEINASTTYNWSFTNGTPSSSNSLNPGQVTFNTSGTNNISLTVTNGCGPNTGNTSIVVNPNPVITGNNTLCVNSTIQLSSVFTPASSSPWTSSNNSIATVSSGGLVTGVSAGSATISFTDNNGCRASFNITVNPIPSLTPPGNQTVCNGNQTVAITLSGSSLPNTNYTWNSSNSAIGLTSTSGSNTIPVFTTTNTTNAPISSTFTVTPVANGCSGASATFTITVNPTPSVTQPPNQTVCNGNTVPAITFGGSAVNGTSYNWSSSNQAIGLPSTPGTNIIPTFTATNNTNAAISSTITVTPTANGCSGSPVTFTITVNPAPVVSFSGPNQVICSGSATTAITLTSTTSGVSFSWTANNTAGVTGFTGSGTNTIPIQTLTNTTNAPVTINYQAQATLGGASACAGSFFNYTITVLPVPKAIPSPSPLTICSGSSANITISSNIAAGVNFSWTVIAGSNISGAASGSGNSISQILSNSGSTPQTVIYSITPSYTSNGITCFGQVAYDTVTVNPVPLMNNPPSSIYCNNTSTGTISFSGNIAGGSYSWEHTNPAIGLSPILGNGNISSFTTANNTNAPINSTFTVTPTFQNTSGPVCPGTPKTFTITVNPTPTVNSIPDKTFCNNTASGIIPVSGPVTGSVFSWQSSNSSIGLVPPGQGDIPSFNTVNNGNAPISSTITITPTYTNPSGGSACQGTAGTFIITINPAPQATSVPTSQIICSGNPASISFSSVPASGVSFQYAPSINPNISGASAGTGSSLNQTLTNTSGTAQTIYYTVTPTYTNNNVACPGPSIKDTVIVNPAPSVNPIADTTVCNGATVGPINFSGPVAGTQFSWSNNNTSIGLSSPGVGNISAFTGINSGTTPQVATITVTPNYSNSGGGSSCPGINRNFTIVINPAPNLVLSPASQIICSGTSTNISLSSSTTSGVTYNWTVTDNSSVTGESGGSGNTISQTLTNTSFSPQSISYNITPVFANNSVACPGASQLANVVINPNPNVNDPADQVLCNGASTTAVNFTGNIPGTVFNWTNTLPSIGLVGPGSGNISPFAVANSTSSPVIATITVTPSYTNSNGGPSCDGTAADFTITANPIPTVNVPGNLTVCNNIATGDLNFSGPVNNALYSWQASNASVGLSLVVGTGNILSFTATNSTSNPITSTITVTPSFTNAGVTCTGPNNSFVITVDPSPQISFSSPDGSFCSGGQTGSVNLSSTTSSSLNYSWSASVNPAGSISGIIPTSGTTNSIPSQTLINLTNLPSTVTYTASAATSGSGNCQGAAGTRIVTVNPKPSIPAVDTSVCSGNAFVVSPQNSQPNSLTIVPLGTTYTWTVLPNSSVSGQSNQTIGQSTISQTLTNLSNTVQTVTYRVAPLSGAAGNCPGDSFSITVRVNPKPKITNQSLTVCSGIPFNVAIPANNPPSVILPSGTLYTWTFIDNASVSGESAQSNPQSSISQTLINNSDQPQVVVYTVTPISGNCPGDTFNVAVTVNPAPYIPDTTAVTCSGVGFSVVPSNNIPSLIVPAGTRYTWTVSNNPNVSGASNQSIPQDTISQTLTNNSNTNQSVVYTVTPVSGAPWNCTGPSFNLTVTLNTKPVIPQQAATVCSGNAFIVSLANNPPNLILPAGTTYTWTVADNPDVNGDVSEVVPQTSISQTLVNLTNAPQILVYNVTPAIGNCAGEPFDVTVIVNPSPLVQPLRDTICSGNSFIITPINNLPDYVIPAGTLYTWTVPDNPNISGESDQSAGQTSIGQTLVNNSNAVQTVVYTVTPLFGNCPGLPFTVRVVINPVPLIPSLDTNLCSGNTINFNPANNPPGIIVPANTTYEWTISTNNSISGQSASSSPQSQFSQVLTNSTNQPQLITYTILPTSGDQGNCQGNPIIINVTVNPAPSFPSMFDTICSGSFFDSIPQNSPPSFIVPAGTLYSWTVPSMPSGPGSLPNAGTSGGVAQTSQTQIFGTLVNTAYNPLNVVYTVTPESPNTTGSACAGSPFSFVVTVNPLPEISNQPLSQSVCNGGTTLPVVFTTNTNNPGANPVYSWGPPLNPANNNQINSGIGDIPAMQLTNNGVRQDTIIYPVITTANGCPGPAINDTIFVNPDALASFTYIRDTACAPFVLDTVITNNSPTTADSGYYWYVNDSLIGTGYIFPGYTIQQSDTFIDVKLITISLYGCKSDTLQHRFYTYNKPVPDFSMAFDSLACSPLTVTFTNLTETHTDTIISPFNYHWDFGNGITSNSAAPGSQTYNGSTRFVDTTYYITLTVTNECYTLTKTDSIRVKSPPKALFAPDRSIVCSNDTAVFYNSSMGLNNTYSWYFGDGSSILNDPSSGPVQHIYNIGNSNTVYDVRLIAVNQCGADTVENPITITPNGIILNYSITNTTNYVCQLDTVRFYNASSGGTRFTWDFGDGSSLYVSGNNVDTIYHVYTNPGTYIIKVIAENNCADTLVTDSVVIIRTPVPDFDIVNNNACPGSSVQFTNQTDLANSYQWNFGDPSSGSANTSTQQSPSHIYSSPGVYTVTLTASLLDASGVVCSKSTSSQVNVVAPIAEIIAPDSACIGDTVIFFPQVTIMPGLAPLQDYSWLINGIPVSGPAQYAPNLGHVFAQAGTYTVSLIVSTITGCSDTARRTIVINPLPSLVMGPDQRICLGQGISINAQSSAGNYSWTPSLGLSDPQIQNPVASPQVTTRYTVTTTNSFGCSRTGSLLVTVIQPFVMNVSANDTICIGQSVQLQADGAVSYIWTPSTGLSCTTCPNPIATPLTTTTYTVSGLGDNSCSPVTRDVTVAVGQYPIVTMPSGQTLATGDTIRILPGYQNGPFSSYQWTPSNDLDCNNCPNPLATIRKDLCYSLIATNIYGCADTGQICFTAFCKGAQVYIPNAFVADGAVSDNTRFTVYGKGIGLVKRMTVFNRWGEVVFEKYNFPVNSPASGWDGKVRGKAPSPDVYVYIVEVVCDNGVPYFYKGNVTLIK